MYSTVRVYVHLCCWEMSEVSCMFFVLHQEATKNMVGEDIMRGCRCSGCCHGPRGGACPGGIHRDQLCWRSDPLVRPQVCHALVFCNIVSLHQLLALRFQRTSSSPWCLNAAMRNFLPFNVQQLKLVDSAFGSVRCNSDLYLPVKWNSRIHPQMQSQRAREKAAMEM